MDKQERIREVVLQLKQVKAERGDTCVDIHNMLIAAGEELSISSVKRVFTEGSENQSFRYRDTLQPLVRVMLSVKEETTKENRPSETEVDALKSVILLKEAMIDELTKEKLKLEAALAEERVRSEEYRQNMAAFRDQVNHLTVQIGRKDKIIDQLKAEGK